MKKTIWLINQYAMSPKYERRLQTIKRAQYLTSLGYEVLIISGSYLHNTDINLINSNKKYIKRNYNGIRFVHIKTSTYKSNGVARIYNMIEFPLRLLILSRRFEKPDIISQVATVPFGNVLYLLTKMYKVTYIVDVLDLWPETFVGLGLVSQKNIFIKAVYILEKWLYKKADSIVFSMEGGEDYIREKKWDLGSGGSIDLDKVHYINNGVDLFDFEKNRKLYRINDPDLSDGKLFKVMYVGSIRLSNNLKQLIDAAEILNNNNKNIVFLIYGDGEERVFLEDYCKRKGLLNVRFKQKWIELKYIPYVLSRSSLNILNYSNSPITRFGSSQSKSFQYMASGKPICANINMRYCPITKYKLGISKEFESPKEYADAILSFANMDPIEYNKMCKNAKIAAKDYDYKKLTMDYEKLL